MLFCAKIRLEKLNANNSIRANYSVVQAKKWTPNTHKSNIISGKSVYFYVAIWSNCGEISGIFLFFYSA